LAKKFSWNFIDYEKTLTFKQIGIFSSFSLAALASTLATPYGLKLYEFLLGYKDSFYQTHVSEWRAQYLFPFQYPELAYLEISFLFLALLLFAAFIFKKECRLKINLWDFFLVASFSLLSFKARRHFPLLFIVSLPILTAFFLNFLKIKSAFLNKIKISPRIIKLAAVIIFFALLPASLLLATKINFTEHPEARYKNKYPLEAITFLRAHPEWNDRLIFNKYGWGGYLIWQYPERKIFIDGRLPQYELNGVTILEEYYSFFDKEKMAEKLKTYNIGLALLPADYSMPKIRQWEKILLGVDEKDLAEAEEKSSVLHDYLLSSPDWQLVYTDGLAEIFIKK
jgi:hypothetical protein